MELHSTSMAALGNLPAPHPQLPVAGKFYSHPYGGIARDICVSKEGFARFFEWSLAEVDFAMMVVQGNGGKVIDESGEWTESLGYIVESNDRRMYMITMITMKPERVCELLQFAPYLWEGNDDCAPQGIERPVHYPVEDPIIWGTYAGKPEDY